MASPLLKPSAPLTSSSVHSDAILPIARRWSRRNWWRRPRASVSPV